MEVAPKYWQYPQMLDRIFFSTAAGNASGTQQTQMPGGTVSGVTPFAAVVGARKRCVLEHQFAQCQRRGQPADQQHLQQPRAAARAAARTARRPKPWCRCLPWLTYVNNHTATQVNHQSGLVAATISFNLPPGGSSSQAQAAIDQAMRELGMPASIHGSFAGAAQVYRAVDVDHAAADSRGVRGRLYRARHSLREHHPSDHHSLDAALGGHRRDPGAADLRHAVLGDRADRHHPADRHRQEERHHDDRRRHSPAAR